MSWFSKNYEKAALGGAAVVALGLCLLGWSKYRSVDETFANNLKGAGDNTTAVPGADLIPKAMQSMKLDRTWKQAMVGDRPVDLFTGIPLFIHRDSPDKAIDLLTAPPVHPPIPNTWWLEHRLDPGFADSPNRDPDGDGFSNLDEFLAGTDPNDAKSIPALVNKLMYVKDESLGWVIRPGFGDGDKFPFTYEDTVKQTNKITAADAVGTGGLFFPKPPMKDRFKLLGHEVRKEVSKSTKVEMEITIVKIEDQRPNKKGKVYELPAPLSVERKNEHVQYDRTAILSLEAIGLSGKEFKVEENTTFALPPSAPKKDYLLKEVTPASIIVEFKDSQGNTKTLTINKGSLPQINK